MSSSSLYSTIQTAPSVMVLFGLDWCHESLALKQYATDMDKSVVYVNIDNDPDIADIFKITKIPTLLICTHGDITQVVVGGVSIRELLKPSPPPQLSEIEQILEFYCSMDY